MSAAAWVISCGLSSGPAGSGSQATAGRSAIAVSTLPQLTAACAAAPGWRRNDSTTSAKNTPDASATRSPARPHAPYRPTKKSAMPANATPTAMASRRSKRSPSTTGASSTTHTTPLYWRKIALAAVVHFVAVTKVVRQAA